MVEVRDEGLTFPELVNLDAECFETSGLTCEALPEPLPSVDHNNVDEFPDRLFEEFPGGVEAIIAKECFRYGRIANMCLCCSQVRQLAIMSTGHVSLKHSIHRIDSETPHNYIRMDFILDKYLAYLLMDSPFFVPTAGDESSPCITSL